MSPSTMALVALVGLAMNQAFGKQQRWPGHWDILSPLLESVGDRSPLMPRVWDPASSLDVGGIRELRRTNKLPRPTSARWQKVQSQENGVLSFKLHPGAQAWAVGEVMARKSRCFRVEVQGSVIQAFLGDQLLQIGWPQQIYFSQGTMTIYVRLFGQGSTQFQFQLSPCSQMLQILEDSEDSPLPEIAGGTIGDVVHLRVHNSNSVWVRGLTLRLLPDRRMDVAPFEGTSELPISLAPGQAGVVSLRVVLRPIDANVSCPAVIHMQLGAEQGLETPLNATRRLKCRNASKEHYLITYLDFDASPQVAAVRPPSRPCGVQGCPVILSLHGMDVPAERQAYSYRPKATAWVLAPHGRSSFAGLNWQNEGHRSAWAALAALEHHSRHFGGSDRRADVTRVIFTGHSNGGFGALLLASERPELALGVAPLAGMIRMSRPALGTGVTGRTGRFGRKLRDLLDASIAPYDLALVAGNIAGIPCLARTGAMDEVIHPTSTRILVDAVREGGGTCAAVEVPGKGHWWWDTESSMDGGAVDDAQMTAFWDKCLQQTPLSLPMHFKIRCVSLDICGGRGGLRILLQQEPFLLSTVTVARGTKAQETWHVQTENILALGWVLGSNAVAATSIAGGGLVLDGVTFSAIEAQGATFACRRPGAAKWRLCPSTAKCCSEQRRRPDVAGPLRTVFQGHVRAVVGTIGGEATANWYLEIAVMLANTRFQVGGGSLTIELDTDGRFPDISNNPSQNLVLLGGPDSNAWTAQILANRSLPDLRLGPKPGQVGIGPCEFEGSDLGVMALGPLPGESGVFALLAASSALAMARLLAVLGGLSERNSWQVRLGDYLILEGPGDRGVDGVLAAGFWGGASGWEWSASRGFVACSDKTSEL